MAQAQSVFKQNFLEYASYVIKERAIPDLMDGFKPVQRRIIHSLFEMDDGKFHKVANVVGWSMRYHPHGDASIYEALVNLANCDLFIERQGNFGNFMTGDSAAAARYIECRLLPFAKKVLYNPELTEFVDSYDGRNKEPVFFPAKIPVVLIQGVTGIAVGMSTILLPHNALEVLDAMAACLKGESFILYPDFPGGGIVDVKDYQNGRGTVSIRAKLNTSDPKKIIIEELPYGTTSEMMIHSVEDAAKKGKLKISSINDYTSDRVNIEINLARNTYAEDIIDALYAYTVCETKISVNPLVIRDNLPTIMGISEILEFHSHHLIEVLKAELELEKGHLIDRLHARTLERIFIEERIYKRIEQKKSADEVNKAVVSGFKPFSEQLFRPIDDEDVERLLKIPIRRISLFDIEKNREEIEGINSQLHEIEKKLANLVAYALDYIQELKKMLGTELHKRKTKVNSFETIAIKEVAERNLSVKYDPSNGYLGYGVKTGSQMLEVSTFDRVLVIRKDGTYQVIDAPEKEFVGKGLLFCGYADKSELAKVTFTLLYQEKTYKYLFLKRCQISSYTLKKVYPLVPEGNYKLVKLSTLPNAELTVTYKPKPGLRILEEKFYFSDYLTKGVKANGVRIVVKDIATIRLRGVKEIVHENKSEPTLFDEEKE
ncbi:type IIA topoisomerase (DNA gyrase/topo II, topoisomerase IV), A subunit [Sphaerochaeta pleomorpha str. Grapes]|uniref:Type IIA topoisomerase (DNA gyrase/topo II, topoisomerase IV), A subunit n=1 Tax=Sphaerochaeta pleomorpha (strain ATCC BAA-1885 / DSM 22778 / Grapes) TaxID=158190 RepID=G8QY93_SPHPG|nr:DNA topoisomerase IV subunit A [Sphaerochaeta pleomorpha]AEV29658.1 type IIA topoisomerase (DNA gyrase/topo II, topoisomerase IV), A subunit [Sphaerochaeta pleomorpha str. Grapes]